MGCAATTQLKRTLQSDQQEGEEETFSLQQFQEALQSGTQAYTVEHSIVIKTAAESTSAAAATWDRYA